MNMYELQFKGKCPVDGEMISYEARIETDDFIAVEDLLTAVKRYMIVPAYQESITQTLSNEFMAEVKIVGTHSGVKITTYRD